MSNIKYKNSSHVLYVNILQKKIDKVCRRIGFDDSKVEWHIFEPKIDSISKTNSILQRILIGQKGENYGYTYISKNEIWISTWSLQKDNGINSITKHPFKSNENKEDFLADVIIDEITHIQTGLDHGCSQYDNQLMQNIVKYYYTKNI